MHQDSGASRPQARKTAVSDTESLISSKEVQLASMVCSRPGRRQTLFARCWMPSIRVRVVLVVRPWAYDQLVSELQPPMALLDW